MVTTKLNLSMTEPQVRQIYAKQGDARRVLDISLDHRRQHHHRTTPDLHLRGDYAHGDCDRERWTDRSDL